MLIINTPSPVFIPTSRMRKRRKGGRHEGSAVGGFVALVAVCGMTFVVGLTIYTMVHEFKRQPIRVMESRSSDIFPRSQMGTINTSNIIVGSQIDIQINHP